MAQPLWDHPLKAWVCESMRVCIHASLANGASKEGMRVSMHACVSKGHNGFWQYEWGLRPPPPKGVKSTRAPLHAKRGSSLSLLFLKFAHLSLAFGGPPLSIL